MNNIYNFYKRLINKIIYKIKFYIKKSFYILIDLELFFWKKSKKFSNKNSKKLLIIRIDNIGDFILFSPTLKFYKKLYSEYSITILVKDINKELAKRFNSVDKIISFDKNKYNNNLFYRRKFLLKLIKENFKIAIYPTYSREPLGDYFIKILNSKEKIGFDGDLSNISAKQKEKNNKYYTKLITANPKVLHEIERNQEFIKKLSGFHIEKIPLSLPISESEKQFAKNLLKNVRKNQLIITFGIGANSKHRLWTINNFYKLTKLLNKKYKIQIILIGGEQDISNGKYLESKIDKNIINLIGKINIFQTTTVLKLCDIYIGNDSGPMHIASAMKTPVIEISCYPLKQQRNHANSPKRFGPWQVPNIILQPQPNCSIKDISVKQVATSTSNLLSKIGSNDK